MECNKLKEREMERRERKGKRKGKLRRRKRRKENGRKRKEGKEKRKECIKLTRKEIGRRERVKERKKEDVKRLAVCTKSHYHTTRSSEVGTSISFGPQLFCLGGFFSGKADNTLAFIVVGQCCTEVLRQYGRHAAAVCRLSACNIPRRHENTRKMIGDGDGD